MTDGMLLREVLTDAVLSRYRVVMIDEVHERSLSSDVIVGLTRGLLALRADLKFVLCSATLESERFSVFLSSPTLFVRGKRFVVEIFFRISNDVDFFEGGISTVVSINFTEPLGDILLFLTGKEEIEFAVGSILERCQNVGVKIPRMDCIPIYSCLPPELQSRVFQRGAPGTRRCVISTNICETSVTIDGIVYVVDTGICKINMFNSLAGCEQLVVVPISRSSALQRSGRAGRTSKGKCFRLYTEMSFLREMCASSLPEIQRCNLCFSILTIKGFSVDIIERFELIDCPPEVNLVFCLETLYIHGALDGAGNITSLGNKMVNFPLEVFQSKSVLSSIDMNCYVEVAKVVSMLQLQNVFYRPVFGNEIADRVRSCLQHPDGDTLTLLYIFNSWERLNYSKAWCSENYLQFRALKNASCTYLQLLGVIERFLKRKSDNAVSDLLVEKALTSGFFMNAAYITKEDIYKTLISGIELCIHPSSSLYSRGPEWIFFNGITFTSKEYMREVQIVNPTWLVELSPLLFCFKSEFKISRRHMYRTVEPLYDGSNDPRAWRLTKRRG
jgi:ATP-dependent RNA helicase DHX8/PRP22